MSGINIHGEPPNTDFERFQEGLRNANVPDGDEFTRQLTDTVRAEPNAEPEPEPQPEPEVAAEEPAERARDDQGRFVSAEEAAHNKLLEERFGGDVNKLADSYAELEKEFHRRNSDTAEIRRELEAIKEAQEYQQQPQQPQWDSRSQSRYDRLLEENPGQAAVEALQRNDWGAYNDALTVWADLEPFQAARFDGELKANMREQQLRSEYEERLHPTEQAAQQTSLARGYAAVAERHPDLNNLKAEVLASAQSSPHIVRQLETGSQEDIERMFDDLYFIARGKQVDLVRGAQEQAKAEQAAEGDQAIQDAIVASASSSPSREGKSRHDIIREGIVGATTFSIQDALAESMRGK